MVSKLRTIYDEIKIKYPDGRLLLTEDESIIFEAEDATVCFTKKDEGYNARFIRNLRNYDIWLMNDRELVGVIELLYKKKISVSELPERPKYAEIRGVMEPRHNKMHPVWRVFFALIGAALTVFVCFMLRAGIAEIMHNNPDRFRDIGLFIFFLFCLYSAISLIRYAFGRFVYGMTLFFGLLITGLGVSEIFFEIDRYVRRGGTTKGLIGGSVLFLLIAFMGVVLIIGSHMRRRVADVTVKRTPVLPEDRDLKRLYEYMAADEQSQAVVIKTDEYAAPVYTGSRAGGEPYGGRTESTYDNYDRNPTGGRTEEELTFLFQINLSEIPSGTVLPESGIMQFFITDVENINDIRMSVKYYPYTDSFDESDFGKSVKLVFEQREMPEINRIRFRDMSDVRNAAAEIGINLSPDLEWQELFEYFDTGTAHEECYLLGPALFYPKSHGSLQRAFDMHEAAHGVLDSEYRLRPLLTLNDGTEAFESLLMNTKWVEQIGMQIFADKYKISHPEDIGPEDIETGFDLYDDFCGNWDL